MRSTEWIKNIALLVIAMVMSGAAVASDWPERPITMIIMSKEGGGMDRASRLVGEALATRLGQPIKYVNRPGASGEIALTMFLEEEADGYTVFSANIPTLTMMHEQREADHAIDEKLRWLGAYLIDPALLVTQSSSSSQSLSDFVAAAKETPARVGVANWSSVQTLALLQFRDSTGAKMEIIPYSGFKGAATALLGNHIEAAVGNFSATQKLGDGVRYLGIFADEAPDGSDVSPIAGTLEIDVIDAASIRALGVHADLADAHPERFEMLEAAFSEVIADQAFVESFSTIGADPSQAVQWDGKEAQAASSVISDLLTQYEEMFKEE